MGNDEQLKKINKIIGQVKSQLIAGEGIGWRSLSEKRRLEHYLQRLEEKRGELETLERGKG